MTEEGVEGRAEELVEEGVAAGVDGGIDKEDLVDSMRGLELGKFAVVSIPFINLPFYILLIS